MGVFAASTKITRAVADPGTDDTLPSPGALSWGGITGVSALAGTTGADAKLVTGDRWQQVSGNHTENLTGNLKTTVSGNQTHAIQGNQTVTVSQDQKETVSGQCQQVIVGPQLVTNFDVRNETRLGPHSQTHGEFEWVNDEDGKIHSGLRQYTCYQITVEYESFHFELAINHLELKGNHFYFAVVDTSVCAFRLNNTEINADISLDENEIVALKAHLKALEPKVGAAEPKAVAAVPLAGVDPNPTPLI